MGLIQNMNNKVVEKVNEIGTVEELEKELQEAKNKISKLEEGINTKQKDVEQVVKEYKQLQSRYDRLFLLYANNLDFYLANKGNE